MAKLMAESNLDANQINVVDDDLRPNLCDMDHCDWYTNVIYYLQHMETPPHLLEVSLNFFLKMILSIVMNPKYFLRYYIIVKIGIFHKISHYLLT